MQSIKGRKRDLAEAVRAFKNSSQNADDYRSFMIAGARALRQGVALSWQEIDEVLDRVLYKEE